MAWALAHGQTVMSSRACTLTIECMVPAGFSGLRATFILVNLQMTGGMVEERWFSPTEDDRKGTGTRAISLLSQIGGRRIDYRFHSKHKIIFFC